MAAVNGWCRITCLQRRDSRSHRRRGLGTFRHKERSAATRWRCAVYPELVIRNPKGEIQGVRYEELAPMLLRQMQQHEQRFDAQAEVNAKQAATIAAQVTEIRDLRARYEAMQKQLAELNDLKQELHAAVHAAHAEHIGLASRIEKAAGNGT